MSKGLPRGGVIFQTHVRSADDWDGPGGGEILIPGEPEARLEAERRRDGIPIEDETWRQIETLAAELGAG